MLGRKAPFPLILLPQFGGYWIEGTNHEICTITAEEEPPSCPTSQIKLESNTIAKIYRKHFLGKVRTGNYNGTVVLIIALSQKINVLKLIYGYKFVRTVSAVK